MGDFFCDLDRLETDVSIDALCSAMMEMETREWEDMEVMYETFYMSASDGSTPAATSTAAAAQPQVSSPLPSQASHVEAPRSSAVPDPTDAELFVPLGKKCASVDDVPDIDAGEVFRVAQQPLTIVKVDAEDETSIIAAQVLSQSTLFSGPAEASDHANGYCSPTRLGVAPNGQHVWSSPEGESGRKRKDSAGGGRNCSNSNLLVLDALKKTKKHKPDIKERWTSCVT